MNAKSLSSVGLVFSLALAALSAPAATVRLDQLEIENTDQGWGDPHRNQSVEGNPLTIGGTRFEHGLGTHATSVLYVNVNGATQFSATVGVDDEVTSRDASVEFFVKKDGKTAWQSGVMRTGHKGKNLTVDLRGAKMLALIVGDAGDGINFDHADWANASFEYDGAPPATTPSPKEEAEILTPPEAPQPRINGPTVVGVRPGHQFFYHVPVTGEAPVSVKVKTFPAGWNWTPPLATSRAWWRGRANIP